MEFIFLFALILLNGAFAMSEIALVTARRTRLQRLIDDGDSLALAAAKLGEDPTRFLSTIQIGIASLGVLGGGVGNATLAKLLSVWLESVEVPPGSHPTRRVNAPSITTVARPGAVSLLRTGRGHGRL